MTRCLSEAMRRTSRLPVQEKLSFHEGEQYEKDIAYMNEVVDHLIKERREHPERESGRVDLLARMLTGADRESRESLDDLNIRYQIITFLIAGHETTSGLLSFSLYLLLHYPAVLARAYAEVDEVLGSDLTARLAEWKYGRPGCAAAQRARWPIDECEYHGFWNEACARVLSVFPITTGALPDEFHLLMNQ
jgi:cytochrome P450